RWAHMRNLWRAAGSFMPWFRRRGLYRMRDLDDILLSRDPSGGLCLVVPGGGIYNNVCIRRALPLSDPDHYIAILDERGEDIRMIHDSGELNSESRQVLNEELERLYVTTVIYQIHSIRNDSGNYHLDVQTGRGRHEIILQNPDENVRWFAAKRLLVTD